MTTKIMKQMRSISSEVTRAVVHRHECKSVEQTDSLLIELTVRFTEEAQHEPA